MKLNNSVKKLLMRLPIYQEIAGLHNDLQRMHSELLLMMKKSALMQDNILSFIYKDEIIKFYLPNAGINYAETAILAVCDFYEREFLEHCSSFITPGSVIIDAGANIGNHTVFLAKFCKAKEIHAFEPQKTAFSIMNENLKLNNINNVKTYNVVLGRNNGFAEVKKSTPSSVGETRFVSNNNGKYEMITIDSLGIEQVGFIKIDVEGSQLEVLNGAQKTLKKYLPVIWIELNECCSAFPSEYSEEHEKDLPHQFLLECGYKLEEKLGQNDFIYVPLNP